MSKSKLVDYTKISPNSSTRTGKISKITIHHMAGNLSVEACASVFQNTDRQASSNYGIGTDGRIGLYVDESRRAWTSSNRDNDNVAVTIEVANDGRDPDWHVSDKALQATIDLCVDICQRNRIAKLNFTGDKSGNLTMHKWFAATQCPGPYLESKFPYIASEVNKRLSAAQNNSPTTNTAEDKKNDSGGSGGVLYRVQVGAYSKKANAEAQLKKIKEAGLDGFIVSEKTETKKEAETTGTIKAGSTVKVKKGAKDYNGGTLASFVYDRKHKVKSISGNRAVITYDGVVVAAVHKDNLILA